MSHIRIDNGYYKIPEFIEFSKAVKSTVYFFLVSAVIRKKNKLQKNNYIHDNYYLKGKLVSRYSQKNMAIYLKTSQPRLSIYIKELEQDGLVKTLYRFVDGKRVLYYQVGTWKGSINKNNYFETFWFDTMFKKILKGKECNIPFIQNINNFLNPEYTDTNDLAKITCYDISR